MNRPLIFVAPSQISGRGVFAGEDFAEGSVIELCPVIVLDTEDTKSIHETRLHDYYFSWGTSGDESALCLGFGSLYNHSEKPNARYDMDFEFETISFVALEDIPIGEEITVDYHAHSTSREKLWFDQ